MSTRRDAAPKASAASSTSPASRTRAAARPRASGSRGVLGAGPPRGARRAIEAASAAIDPRRCARRAPCRALARACRRRSRSATSPAGTKRFAPESSPRHASCHCSGASASPLRRARRCRAARRREARQPARLLRGLPPCDERERRERMPRNGPGVPWKPSVSATSASSTISRPAPPCASGTTSPATPSSHRPCQSVGSCAASPSKIARTRVGGHSASSELADRVLEQLLLFRGIEVHRRSSDRRSGRAAARGHARRSRCAGCWRSRPRSRCRASTCTAEPTCPCAGAVGSPAASRPSSPRRSIARFATSLADVGRRRACS